MKYLVFILLLALFIWKYQIDKGTKTTSHLRKDDAAILRTNSQHLNNPKDQASSSEQVVPPSHEQTSSPAIEATSVPAFQGSGEGVDDGTDFGSSSSLQSNASHTITPGLGSDQFPGETSQSGVLEKDIGSSDGPNGSTFVPNEKNTDSGSSAFDSSTFDSSPNIGSHQNQGS